MASSKEEIEAGIKAMLWSKSDKDAPAPSSPQTAKARTPARPQRSPPDHSRSPQTGSMKPDQAKKPKNRAKNARQENGQYQTVHTTPKSENQGRVKSGKGGNSGKGNNSFDSSRLSTNSSHSTHHNSQDMVANKSRRTSHDGFPDAGGSATKSQNRRQRRKKNKDLTSAADVEMSPGKKKKSKKVQKAENIPGNKSATSPMEEKVANFFKQAGSVAQNMTATEMDIIAKLNLGKYK